MNNSINQQDRAFVAQILSKTGKKYGVFSTFYNDECLFRYKSNFQVFLEKIICDFEIPENTINKRGLQFWFNSQIKRIEAQRAKAAALPSFEKAISEDSNEPFLFQLTEPNNAPQTKRLLTKPKI